MTQTLLERWDESHTEAMQWAPDKIRRALAVAQAVEDYGATFGRPLDMAWIMRRADELLECPTSVPTAREPAPVLAEDSRRGGHILGPTRKADPA